MSRVTDCTRNCLPAQRRRQPSRLFKSLSSISWRRPYRNTWGGWVTERPHSRQRSVRRTIVVFVPQDGWQFLHCSTVTQFSDSLLTHFALTSTWPHFSSISSRNVVFTCRLQCHCAHTPSYLPPPLNTLPTVWRSTVAYARIYIDCDETRSERGRTASWPDHRPRYLAHCCCASGLAFGVLVSRSAAAAAASSGKVF